MERVTGTAPVPMELLLDALPAAVQAVAGETDHMDTVRDGDGFGRGGLEAGEPIRRDDVDAVWPCLRPRGG
jgi:hypothetical protein